MHSSEPPIIHFHRQQGGERWTRRGEVEFKKASGKRTAKSLSERED
jgi:hypothetical protein